MSSHSSQIEPGSINPDWHEVDELLERLAQASKTTTSATQFYRLLLEPVVPAIGASGGAIWTSPRPGELVIEFQIALEAARATAGADPLGHHQALVYEVLRTAEPRIVPPQQAGAAGQSINPSACTLFLYPIQSGGQGGVIELVQHREMPPATRREYLKVLAALAELADDFHRNQELSRLRGFEQTWRGYERFTLEVHRGLDVNRTAFVIANEGRRIIDCDRVSLMLRRGRKCQALAISGVDALDRRAEVVRRLERLATSVIASGDPLWYCESAADMPVEIEAPLHAYLDESHARALAIVPLYDAEPEAGQRAVIGALVAEQFQVAGTGSELRQRTTAVAEPSAVALANSLTHSHRPLARVSRALSRMGWLTRGRQLPKTLLVLLAVASAIAALVLIPADFDIEARGELQPERRREVFATSDGVIDELLVDHGGAVKSGQPVLVIRKPELDLELSRVVGEMQTAEKKLAAIQSERLTNAKVTPETRRSLHQLTADEEELKKMLEGLAQQRQILEAHKAELVVRSPIDAQALTWNLKELLQARPVERGQTLLTVADLDGPWELDLHVGDHRVGHVLAAQEELQPKLAVSFALASEPGTVYEGTLKKIALATEVDHLDKPSVTATVAFDRSDVAGLRPGATVIAQIHCGRRSIGYVWLHDLLEAIQSHWWW